jgi:hypothetical protein
MSTGLSPQIEQKIAAAVASGLFPSREALIEAGVAQLLDEHIPLVPAEHMARVEEAIESSHAGLSRPMTDEDWQRLRDRACAVAAKKEQCS